MFRGGRTEYTRSPTNETLKFILAFGDPSVTVRNARSLFLWGWCTFHFSLSVIFMRFTCAIMAAFLLLSCSERQSCNCSEKLLMLMQIWLTRWTTSRLCSFCRPVSADRFLSYVCFPAVFRHWKDMALTATCWASSCRPSRKDWAFPKSSWTQLTAWQHTGNSERDRCVSLCVKFIFVSLKVVWLSKEVDSQAAPREVWN